MEAQMTEFNPADASRVSIIDKSIMISVEFSRFGNRRKAGLGLVSVNAEKAMLNLTKRLLKSKEFDAIVSHDREVVAWLNAVALPFPVRNGSYLIPIPIVDQVEQQMQTFLAARQTLIAAFCAAYPQQVADIEKELRDLYNPRDYPTLDVVRQKFGFAWQYLDYGVPGRLKTLNLALFQQAKEKMEVEVRQATEEVQQGLRAGMLGLVEHLCDRLTPGEDGKPRVFRNTLIENMAGFLNTFDVRNITNDAELQTLVQQARSLISGVAPDDVRKNEGLRAALAQGFQNLKAQIDPLVIERTRRINIDDDSEAAAS
jgi:hypothetical protein